MTPYEEIQLLEEKQAEHIKGWKCGQFPDEDILKYAHLEVQELQDSPDDILEMADSLICLYSYCARKKWTQEQIDEAMKTKLRARFKNAEEILKTV